MSYLFIIPEPSLVYGIDGIPAQIQAPETSQVHCHDVGAVSCAGALVGFLSWTKPVLVNRAFKL